MTRFLVATLYAPLASWGDIAVGEVRGTWDRPSRSSVLGLLAAALGITRADDDALAALDTHTGVAVRVDRSGALHRDFHTVQTVRKGAVKKRTPRTRRELLNIEQPKTIVSERYYREDASYTLAVWSESGARWDVSALAESLRAPRFVLYAGRKANALGLPLAPDVIEASTLAEALSRRPAVPDALRAFFRSAPRAGSVEVSHDPCSGFSSGLTPLRTERRRDATPDRRKWLFSERLVEVGTIPSVGA